MPQYSEWNSCSWKCWLSFSFFYFVSETPKLHSWRLLVAIVLSGRHLKMKQKLASRKFSIHIAAFTEYLLWVCQSRLQQKNRAFSISTETVPTLGPVPLIFVCVSVTIRRLSASVVLSHRVSTDSIRLITTPTTCCVSLQQKGLTCCYTFGRFQSQDSLRWHVRTYFTLCLKFQRRRIDSEQVLGKSCNVSRPFSGEHFSFVFLCICAMTIVMRRILKFFIFLSRLRRMITNIYNNNYSI